MELLIIHYRQNAIEIPEALRLVTDYKRLNAQEIFSITQYHVQNIFYLAYSIKYRE